MVLPEMKQRPLLGECPLSSASVRALYLSVRALPRALPRQQVKFTGLDSILAVGPPSHDDLVGTTDSIGEAAGYYR